MSIRGRLLLALAAGAAALAFSTAAPMAQGTGLTGTSDGQALTYRSDRYRLLDPARPDGPAIAVLRGDPATGPSDMLMRFGPMPPVMHTHTANYRLVVLKGEMKHWVQGQTAADVEVLGPGSFWYQPGGQPHADLCLSDRCEMFISWDGKRDAHVAP
ncbi:MAG TPA: DUF4437 domain-containing protein [Caulobacter sp.]|nr:DUF4437 domain-containing protein [Caulobacter sp.]